MITLHRNTTRHSVRRDGYEMWRTFHPNGRAVPFADGFGDLRALDEIRLSSGGCSAFYPPEEAEIVTYVYRGALAQEDSTGNSGVVHAGEFQRMTISRGVRHKETNASATDCAHTFRISLRPSEVGLVVAPEQKRFAAAQRRNSLCVVASRDGRKGSLRLSQDALVYSAVLDPGRHLIHELRPGRIAWLHLVDGEATLHDIMMTRGDGGGVTIEPSVSLTARENTEILLVDLGPVSRSCASGVVP